MNYDEVAKLAKQLSYRDKFRLAQLLKKRYLTLSENNRVQYPEE